MPPTEPRAAGADTGAIDPIDALIERGELEAAERLCRERIAAGAAEARLFSQLAGLCGRAGRWQELRQWVARALALDPNDAKAHSHLGVAQRQAGELEAAGASFRRALAIRPDDARSRNNLGTVLQEQGELAAAHACYDQAIAAQPDFAEAHTNRGMLLLLQGSTARAGTTTNGATASPAPAGGCWCAPAAAAGMGAGRWRMGRSCCWWPNRAWATRCSSRATCCRCVNGGCGCGSAPSHSCTACCGAPGSNRRR
jgi:Flp pilus assembly protein TadD